MITLIPFSELKKLYRDKVLTKSDNFDFISDPITNFLSNVYQETNELNMATILYVDTVNGNKVQNVGNEVLDDMNSDALAFLSIPDGDVVALIVKPSEPLMTFSEITLDSLQDTSLSLEEEQIYYAKLLREGAQSMDRCGYAVTSSLKKSDVLQVLYQEQLEDKIKALEETDKERSVLFSATKVFG